MLVGHVTKDGSIAGPRALEHLVDVVLHFEGDRHAQLRMVRAVKNRYGPTDEIGCFDLGENGLTGLADPSGLFLSQQQNPVPGTCVTVTLEGRRPLLAEVQALVTPSSLDIPRRVTSGLDGSRVGMVLAVLSRRADLQIGRQDVYAATVGGVRLTEPSVDLAIALALASGLVNLSVPGSVVAFGEVGLAGEVRRVSGVQRRLAEAARMGFRRAIVPAGWADRPAAANQAASGARPRRRAARWRRPRGPGRPGRYPGERERRGLGEREYGGHRRLHSVTRRTCRTSTCSTPAKPVPAEQAPIQQALAQPPRPGQRPTAGRPASAPSATRPPASRPVSGRAADPCPSRWRSPGRPGGDDGRLRRLTRRP